jgi:hypothetical protein
LVGTYRKPTTVVATSDEGEPPSTLRFPVQFTPSWIVPLEMIAGSHGASTTSMSTVPSSLVDVPSFTVKVKLSKPRKAGSGV